MDADINIKMNYGFSPLSVAKERKHNEIVKIIQERMKFNIFF